MKEPARICTGTKTGMQIYCKPVFVHILEFEKAQAHYRELLNIVLSNSGLNK